MATIVSQSLHGGKKRDGKFKYQKLMLIFFGCQKLGDEFNFISQFSNGMRSLLSSLNDLDLKNWRWIQFLSPISATG